MAALTRLCGFGVSSEKQDSVGEDDCSSGKRAVQEPKTCNDVNRVRIIDRVEKTSEKFRPNISRTAVEVRHLE